MKSTSKLYQGSMWVNNRLLGIETFIMALITITLVAAIFIEVICRYFLFIAVAWAEELTRYLFIWLTYIGSAYAVWDGSHTEIDILKQIILKSKSPHQARNLKILEVLAIVSTFTFLTFFAKIFFDYMMRIWATTQTSPTMHVPMGLVYLPVFIGTVLAALHEVFLLMRCFAENPDSSQAAAQ